MGNLLNHSTKLVYPAHVYHQYMQTPASWNHIFGDGNFSLIAFGQSGSGKDVVCSYALNNDLKHNRTVIILDVKMEYPCSIFCQQDVVLRNVLSNNRLVGRGYKINLWIPYIQGIQTNHHLKELLASHHPNLKIRPFRILKPDLVSEDTANMALAKSHLQSIATKGNRSKLIGQTRILDEFKEEMGKIKLAFDDENLWKKGCGWEYINFDQVSINKEVNVISTFFMMGQNVVAATSFMIGLMNEFLSIGKGIHRYRSPDETFSILIPEVQIIMPKRVRALENVVNTLQYSMLVGLLLMRSFGVRLRLNLQNLSSLPPDMLSQTRIFAGRTRNPKDLNLLNIFGIKKKDRMIMLRLKTGDFVDIDKRVRFSVVPFCHKARENEPFIKMLKQYKEDPSEFLYETQNGFLTEILDTNLIGGRFPMTVKEYNQRVKQWMSRQTPREIMDLPENNPNDVFEMDKALQELGGVV